MYEMFFARRGEVDSSALPPCEESFLQHTRRANYQAGIWRCLASKPDVPEPDNHGWTRAADSMLHIDWITDNQLQMPFWNLYLVSARENVSQGSVVV